MKRNFLLFLFSLLVALFGAEAALQLTGTFAPPPYPPEPWMPELYTSYPAYGYALLPGRTLQYEYPPARPRRLTVNSNSDGFRNRRELDEDDPRTRVWVLGDSYHGVLRALSGPTRPYSRPTREEWELNASILDRLREIGREHEFSPVLVYLAGPWKGAAQDRRSSWVREYGEEHGVPVLDLTEPIQSAGDSIYLPENRHYGPSGHRIVATELHAFLTRHVQR